MRKPTPTPWTEQEDAILRAHFASMGPTTLVRQGLLPGRTVHHVGRRALVLGLTRITANAGRPWGEAEMRVVRSATSLIDLPKLSRRLPGRTRLEILRKLRTHLTATMGQPLPPAPWTVEEDALLFAYTNLGVIQARLPTLRSQGEILQRRSELEAIGRNDADAPAVFRLRPWQTDEKELLRQRALAERPSRIAERLGRPVQQIRDRARLLGLPRYAGKKKAGKTVQHRPRRLRRPRGAGSGTVQG